MWLNPFPGKKSDGFLQEIDIFDGVVGGLWGELCVGTDRGERVRGRLKNPACAEESQLGQHIMALLATTLKKNCKMNE